ncbi:hypothetical protein GCM10025867_18080 [Frondihabitans sucicola]|uniref:DUF2029 domain-containing protein n=1 Tax=Frondihabitans sucicola TaxID=1268041 RepID=A0ABM8GMC4_9MICO|nr:glycosyltransferase family 87 protein [Frondihabitans sucicola]BDZ49567.1 hypothetical protein GCM10025867_18080 [Frondihabitans sucicola]
MRTFLGLLGVTILAATVGWGVHALGFYVAGIGHSFQLWTLVCWALFIGAFLLLRRVPAKSVTVVVLVGAALVGGAAVSGPPNTSTDSARYAWDGIVQDHGLSPYEHTPNSRVTESLRTPWLFPATVTTSAGKETCTGTRVFSTHEYGSHERLCTTINRPSVLTIYPAAAELYFAAVRGVVAVDAAYWPLQAAGLILSLAITVGLLVILRRRSLDPRWAALWAWCPLVASEGITNSHIDLLAAGFALVATALVAGGRRWFGGIALGAAIATKLIPIVAAPALLRRQPAKIIVGAAATFVLLYVPYLLSTGPKVLGYLPGYLSEEGVDDGSGFALVYLFVHGKATTVVAVLILLVVAVIVWRTTDPAAPWLGQLVMIGTFLFVLSPRYPWYALLLVPFVALTGRWEWLAVALAISVRQFWPFAYVRASTLGVALLIIVIVSIHRSGPGWWGRIRERARDEWALLRRRPLPAPGVRQ